MGVFEGLKPEAVWGYFGELRDPGQQGESQPVYQFKPDDHGCPPGHS